MCLFLYISCHTQKTILMKLKFSSILLATGLLAFTVSSFSIFSKKDNWVEEFKQIDQEVEKNSQAYSRLGESIQLIGHRMTGSVNGTQAEEYVKNLLESYGFDEVEFQEFEMNGWLRGALSLEVQSGSSSSKLAIPAQSLAYSPANVDMNADLVDMGNGLESDYEANPELAKGKIVVAALNLLPGSPSGTSNVHRSSKVALAARYGAKGIILFNSVAGGTLLTGTASIDGSVLQIPAINIGLEDGMKLKEALKGNAHVGFIKMTNQVGKMKARNVIARIKGQEFPNEKVVVGGHMDSWDLSPGAVDNGLGSFSVIDMARTLKVLNLKPRRTLEFVLFMGEEQGLLGSRAYVKRAVEEGTLDQIRFMMNYDMTNNPSSFTASREESKAFLEGIAKQVNQVLPNFNTNVNPRAGLYSDHQPFMLQGIAIGGAGGGRLSQKASQCYHADCDEFSLINEVEMKQTVRVGAMLAFAVADASEIPLKKQTDSEIHEMMLKYNLKDGLKMSFDWRWND